MAAREMLLILKLNTVNFNSLHISTGPNGGGGKAAPGASSRGRKNGVKKKKRCLKMHPLKFSQQESATRPRNGSRHIHDWMMSCWRYGGRQRWSNSDKQFSRMPEKMKSCMHHLSVKWTRLEEMVSFDTNLSSIIM